MANLTDLTIAQLVAAMGRKEASAVEVADAHLKKLDEHRALNAFITETPDKARAMAKASDERRARGQAGLLEGVPLGIKDLFCTEGVQTTAASHILEGFVPQYESTVTANLWKQGAVMVGKTNLDEFAMGSSTENSAFGVTLNPRDTSRVAGGSSGGSAAAVAAGRREAAVAQLQRVEEVAVPQVEPVLDQQLRDDADHQQPDQRPGQPVGLAPPEAERRAPETPHRLAADGGGRAVAVHRARSPLRRASAASPTNVGSARRMTRVEIGRV